MQKEGAIRYGQSRLDISDEVDLEKDRPRYEADSGEGPAVSTTNGIDAVMKQHQLDAILFPGLERVGPRRAPGLSERDRAVRARAQRADAAVPRRASTRSRGPYGVSFSGHRVQRAAGCSALAYAFEQATKTARAAAGDAVGGSSEFRGCYVSGFEV